MRTSVEWGEEESSRVGLTLRLIKQRALIVVLRSLGSSHCLGLWLAASATPRRALPISSENIHGLCPFPHSPLNAAIVLVFKHQSTGAFRKPLYRFALYLLQSGLSTEEQTVNGWPS